jgi:PAS domain S-box-containing protein
MTSLENYNTEFSKHTKINPDKSLHTLMQAFSNLNEGVIIFDDKKQIYYVNEAFLKFHHIASEDEAGKLLYENFNYFFIDIAPSSAVKNPFQQILEGISFDNSIIKLSDPENIAPKYGKYSGRLLTDVLYMISVLDVSECETNRIQQEVLVHESLNELSHIYDYQKKLENEKELLQAIIDTIPVMITIYDPEIKDIYLNKAVEHITGWTNEDAKEKSIMELAYPDEVYRNEVSEFMASLESGFKDILMHTKNGNCIETSWANVAITDGRQVGIGIDISQRKKMEKKLIKAKDKAVKLKNMQTSFIQNISHEVRTPMNSILGFTELLMKEYSSESAASFLKAIQYNSQQLLGLINDIVDISRADKNELTLQQEHVMLDEIIENSAKQLYGLKRTHNKESVDIKINKPLDESGIMLYTDPQRLQQVITNLISNAIKYTDKGTIELGYELPANKDNVQIYIKDSGTGIPKKYHSRVFKRFHQFDPERKSRHGGTGLGLAICKQLVKLQGGSIGFDSKEGEGSTFYFTHPVSNEVLQSKNTSQKAAKKVDHSLNLEGKTILIAEDDQFSYMMLVSMLKDTNAKILHAPDGEKAKELISSAHIDLALLDIRLPQISGFDLVKLIKSKNPRIPVIAQTANAMEEEKDQSLEAGFDHHAVKPISVTELHTLMRTYLGSRSKQS